MIPLYFRMSRDDGTQKTGLGLVRFEVALGSWSHVGGNYRGELVLAGRVSHLLYGMVLVTGKIHKIGALSAQIMRNGKLQPKTDTDLAWCKEPEQKDLTRRR